MVVRVFDRWGIGYDQVYEQLRGEGSTRVELLVLGIVFLSFHFQPLSPRMMFVVR